jgi:hypothetical protein
MIVPSAANIEQAIGDLASTTAFVDHEWVLADQQQELHAAMPSASNDFIAGYTLGVQAARVMVAGLPEAIINKISI